ncbi:acyltransferase [Patescibacteria group bacterium]
MKKAITKTLYKTLEIIGGKNFSNKHYPVVLLARFLFVQKFFRFNSHVPWPVHWTSKIIKPENIVKGTRNPGMAVGCYIDARNGVRIGKNVWVGPKVSIISMNHSVNDYYKFEKANPIIIGNDCWLATNSTILAGVELGNHVIVAAGAVVTKSFKEDDILLAGVPAKIVKKLEAYGTN